MTDAQTPGPSQGVGRLPSRGSFAVSEVLPLIQQASAEVRGKGDEWRALREESDRKRAHAKQVRANLIVRLRVWGNEGTGDNPIKTSAERQEWASADPEVQQAELDADLAQTVQMAAREAYADAQGRFEVLRSMLAIERDDAKREWTGPQ
jgi:hypothetical protein